MLQVSKEKCFFMKRLEINNLNTKGIEEGCMEDLNIERRSKKNGETHSSLDIKTFNVYCKLFLPIVERWIAFP